MQTHSSTYLKQQYATSNNLEIRIRLHELYSVPSVDWHDWLFDQLQFQAGDQVIEFGCGTGTLWEKNSSKINPACRYTLTDMSEGMLEKTKLSLGERPNFAYRTMDVQNIEAEDGIYDKALANHMLYHVPDVSRALAEIKRVLKPGGTFYASTNGSGHIKEMYELVAEFDPAFPFVKPMNAKHFGLENGERQLKPHFEHVRLVPFESGLRVTDVHDLAEYIFSMGSALQETLLQDGRYDAFLAFLESKKDESGAIPITKESGVFICQTAR